MEFSAQMIAELIGGTIVGNPEATVSNFAKIEEGRTGTISFLANDKYEHYIYSTESSIVLVNNDFEPKENIKATLIKVPNARQAVATLIGIYESMKPKPKGIDPLASIASSATIGKDVYIGPFVYIGNNASIGDGCVIHPNVSIGEGGKIGDNTTMYANSVVYHNCKIGQNCILHAGSVIGADGFGFEPSETGYNKIPQIGIVVLEDNVEIGANACVDRAVMGETIIRKGTKIDNLVQIGHNCEVGQHTVMSAQVGVAGSTKIGEWCMFGGQVGIAGHATIANRTMAGAQSGIPNSVKKEGQELMGTPAIEPRTWWKAQAVIKQLPDMWTSMNRMKKEIEELKAKLDQKGTNS
ncbi:MAG: UDP-3-O-(3-hydroxymyristoyl)glucosamine N-acyltransferase [Bacteroidaceae bacterium]|nr:UDP-3-O-(3-hydroxymyristoyl)glucosamine N-acyltransferase [Bacteroidaceae bacterium]